MTQINASALRSVVLAAAAGLLLGASVATAQSTIPGGPGPSSHPGHGPSVPLPSPVLVRPVLPPTPPFDPGLAAPGRGPIEDFYCHDSNANYAACDAAFKQKCDDAGGTMSGEQGWGGQTCFEPS